MQHLTCFAGGMLGLGAKLLDRKQDLVDASGVRPPPPSHAIAPVLMHMSTGDGYLRLDVRIERDGSRLRVSRILRAGRNFSLGHPEGSSSVLFPLHQLLVLTDDLASSEQAQVWRNAIPSRIARRSKTREQSLHWSTGDDRERLLHV